MRRERRTMLLVCLVILVPCVLVGWHCVRLQQYRQEFAPLLDRARSLMMGTATPAPSEEQDGSLYDDLRFRQDLYPDIVRINVSKLDITDAEIHGDEAVLTVDYAYSQYRADGSVFGTASIQGEKWYAKRTDAGWKVYRVVPRYIG